MSLAIEFKIISIEQTVSTNNILGISEVELDKIHWGKGCNINSNIIWDLFEEANNWGEVYNKPHNSKFLFYFLGRDFESNIGFKEMEGKTITLGFDPEHLKEFFTAAANLTVEGKNGTFNEINEILDQAILQKNLIAVHWE